MVRTTRLGGTASNIEVASIAHGLMLMTWCSNPIPDEQAFQAIKAGVDAADSAKVLLNAGEFYGYQLSNTNLEMLARFYEKFPDYVDKTVLCVKGGLQENVLRPLATEENIRRSVDNINAKLRGTKRVDIYENARVDRSRPIEETIGIMKKLVQEGKFDHIGMSECSGETLRRANAVHPIASVEIEVSLSSYEEEAKKVVAVAAELNVAVLAYSPLGRGLLTGRRDLHNFRHNMELVDRLTAIAKKRGATPGQLSLAWILSLGPHMIPLPGSSKSTRTIENLAASDIVLTPKERAEVDQIMEAFEARNPQFPSGTQNRWA